MVQLGCPAPFGSDVVTDSFTASEFGPAYDDGLSVALHDPMVGTVLEAELVAEIWGLAGADRVLSAISAGGDSLIGLRKTD